MRGEDVGRVVKNVTHHGTSSRPRSSHRTAQQYQFVGRYTTLHLKESWEEGDDKGSGNTPGKVRRPTGLEHTPKTYLETFPTSHHNLIFNTRVGIPVLTAIYLSPFLVCICNL